MKAITREYLDSASCDGCDDPDCDGELFIHSRCHPEAAPWASYKDGVVTFACGECREPIVAIQVAGTSKLGKPHKRRP